MLNGIGTRIFEIPVYGIEESLFKKKWRKKEDNYVATGLLKSWCKNLEAEDKRSRGIFNKYEKVPYKYNQIVGFIVISIDKSDVIFDLYLNHIRYSYNSKKTTKSIKYISRTGDHLYIGDMKSNYNIAEKIKNYISHEVLSLKQKRNYFLDTTAFDAVIDHIDFFSIINKEGKNNV